MHLEGTINSLRKEIAKAEDHKDDPQRLAGIWQAIKEILEKELAPALQDGAALPLPPHNREKIDELLNAIAKLEQSLHHRSAVIDGFVPSKNGTPKA